MLTECVRNHKLLTNSEKLATCCPAPADMDVKSLTVAYSEVIFHIAILSHTQSIVPGEPSSQRRVRAGDRRNPLSERSCLIYLFQVKEE